MTQDEVRRRLAELFAGRAEIRIKIEPNLSTKYADECTVCGTKCLDDLCCRCLTETAKALEEAAGLRKALAQAIIPLAALKITDKQQNYVEFSPKLRELIYEAETAAVRALSTTKGEEAT